MQSHGQTRMQLGFGIFAELNLAGKGIKKKRSKLKQGQEQAKFSQHPDRGKQAGQQSKFRKQGESKNRK